MRLWIWMMACALQASTTWAQAPAFDSHVHLREGEKSLREYQAQVRDAGISLAGAAVMWFGGPHQAPAGNPGDIRARNDEMLELAKRHPEITAVATVHPYDGQAALDEVARVAARGIKVLKIHPHTQRFDASDPRVLTLVQRAGEVRLIVLMDNANILPGDSEKLFNLAAQAPDTRFIFAHIGALNFRFWNILKLARTADGFGMNNVYFDISGTVSLLADSPLEAEFVWTLRNVGIDHVLLGSDYPQMTLEQAVKGLNQLELTEKEKNGILSGNARRLLGL